MIVKYNGITYQGEQVEVFSTGAIFIKPLGKAFWEKELDFINRKRKEPSFFMVYVDGGRQPEFMHTDMNSAENEAKRLALITGRKSYVLCSLDSYLSLLMDCRVSQPYLTLNLTTIVGMCVICGCQYRSLTNKTNQYENRD